MTNPTRTYHFLITAKRRGALGVSYGITAHVTAANIDEAVLKLSDEYDHIDVIQCLSITIDGTHRRGQPHLSAAWDGYGLIRAVFSNQWPAGKQVPELQIGQSSSGYPRDREFPPVNQFVWCETDSYKGALRWDGELWWNRDGYPIGEFVREWDADGIHPSRREYQPNQAAQ